MLNSSNLGWIQGRFSTNYNVSDLRTKEEEADKKDWDEVGGDTGYPEEFKIIFEFEDKTIDVFKTLMKPELFTRDIVMVEIDDKVFLGQLKGCNVILEFIAHDLGDQQPYYGMFTASLWEDDINSHLDKIINSYA